MKKDASKLYLEGPGENVKSGEYFCTQAYSIASTADRDEPGIINRKFPLDARISLAYAVLLSILHSRSYGGGGVVQKEEGSKELAKVEEKSYYELLGVKEEATQEEIESAYEKRQSDLNPDALEKKLRQEGLSEEVIKIQIEKAKRDFEDIQEAHAVLGNKQGRKHYDDFRKRGQGITEVRAYKTLGVSPEASQTEIRDAFRNKQKELNSYVAQADLKQGKISQEEYDAKINELKDINYAYSRVFDRKKYDEERTGQNIVITGTPTTPADETALKETADIRKTVAQAGNITITPEETVQLRSVGVQPETINAEKASHAGTIALNAHVKLGLKAEPFSEAVDKSGLPADVQETLQVVAFDMEALERTNPKQATSLAEAMGNPLPVIEQTPQTISPGPTQIQLQNQGGGILQMISEEAAGKGLDIVKEKGEKAIVGAVEKGGVKAANKAAQKITVEALNKGGKELLTKAASKIAVKLGLSAAGAAATGGTSLLVQLVLEVGQRLIKAATKVFRGLVKLITGKEGSEGLRDLAFMSAAFFMAVGAVAPAAVAGIVGIGAHTRVMGGGQIAGSAVGVFSAFVYGVGAIAASISGTIIASFIITIFLIIFIIVIINNSAFIVPQGGFQFNIGQLNPADLVCNEYQGHTYCFPVVPVPDVLATCAHHDYVATDINLINTAAGVPATVAFTDGEIIYASGGDPTAGNAIIQLGDDGYIYSYFHLGSISVSQGDSVTAGQLLGSSGNTGNASGLAPMTHFQAMDLDFCPYPSTPAACGATYDSACLAAGGTRTSCVLPYVDHFTCPSRIFGLVFGGTISCGPDTAYVGCGGPPPAATCYNRPGCTQEPFNPS